MNTSHLQTIESAIVAENKEKIMTGYSPAEQAANAEHINRLAIDAEYRKAQAIERIDSLIAELQYSKDQLISGKTFSEFADGTYDIGAASASIGKACDQYAKSLRQIAEIERVAKVKKLGRDIPGLFESSPDSSQLPRLTIDDIDRWPTHEEPIWDSSTSTFRQGRALP